jgi:GAF domain-containing protein
VTDAPRETLVLQAVVSVVDTLLYDFDVVDLLTEVTERCEQLLDIDSAGLLLADPRRQLHLMAATSEATRDLEVLQLQAEEGPCLDCFTSGAPVSVADLSEAGSRWPRFVASATEAGFSSVHAVPMRAAGTVLGALGLFGTRRGQLNDADLLLGQTLAHIACVAILQERAPTPESVLPRLNAALASRVVVEQAKGFVHERLDVSLADAFGLLRSYARQHGDHLTAVARRLVHEPLARPAILDAMTHLSARSQRQP